MPDDKTTPWSRGAFNIGTNLRVLLLGFGFATYLVGIHPGGEIMTAAAVALLSWRDYP